MDYPSLQHAVRTSSALKLLRSQHAPLIVSFLHRQFKEKQRLAIPSTALVQQLQDWIEHVSELEPGAYPQSAQAYLDSWCGEEHRYLRKYYDARSDDAVFELTPETEKVLQWIDDLSKTEFVGTESRFLRIFELLEEIVDKSTEDPEIRLEQLQRQKQLLEDEIERIRRTGEVETYNITQVKERFLEANRTARGLLGDFREVEQNFKEITRKIQEEQLATSARKGDIVGYVLDADQHLKESDQGRSFYAFWKFLLSPEKQDQLEELIALVYSIPDLGALKEDHRLLKFVKNYLLEAGEKIVQSNYRLAEQLRRLLDERNLLENRRVTELIDEIKKCAIAVVDAPPMERDFIEIDDRPVIDSAMARPLWSPSDRPDFGDISIADGSEEIEEVDFSELFNRFAIDTEEIRKRIESELHHHKQITLLEMIERYPIQKGLSELIAYFSVAGAEQRHFIDDATKDDIWISDGIRRTKVSVPRVLFMRTMNEGVVSTANNP